VERNYFDTHVLTEECYRPLLIEGLQQARDTRLPGVSIHRQFKVLIEDTLDSLFRPASPRSRTGGEGGGGRGCAGDGRGTGPRRDRSRRRLEQFETALLHAHGFTSAGMGLALRSDTACVALLALVHEAIARG
jgi:16S rRNA U1498 N3-methylase RsmE